MIVFVLRAGQDHTRPCAEGYRRKRNGFFQFIGAVERFLKCLRVFLHYLNKIMR